MFNGFEYSKLHQFFHEILKVLEDTNKEAVEIWCDPSDLNSLKKFERIERSNFLLNFDFIRRSKGNYVSINKVLFILDCIKYLDTDLKNLSKILNYNGFESLIYEILLRNGFYATKNFRFSDKSNFKSKTSQGRYEIDVIGIHKNFVLLIDAKQWRRKDSFSSMNGAANLQLQRVYALKKNPDVFTNLIHKLLGLRQNILERLPFVLIPMMVTFEESFSKLNTNSIPLVSIYRFPSFLLEYENYLQYYKTVKIKKISVQTTLF